MHKGYEGAGGGYIEVNKEPLLLLTGDSYTKSTVPACFNAAQNAAQHIMGKLQSFQG